jgi:hypothetical protein
LGFLSTPRGNCRNFDYPASGRIHWSVPSLSGTDFNEAAAAEDAFSIGLLYRIGELHTYFGQIPEILQRCDEGSPLLDLEQTDF